MVGTLNPDQIDEVLVNTEYASLGCHADAQTYVIPISFALDGRRIIGMTTRGKKIEMMRKNPEVCLSVQQVKDLTNWRSVVIWGNFVELEGTNAAAAAGLMIDKFGPAFAEMNSDSRRGRNLTPDRIDGQMEFPIVYAIEIREATGRYEGSTA